MAIALAGCGGSDDSGPTSTIEGLGGEERTGEKTTKSSNGHDADSEQRTREGGSDDSPGDDDAGTKRRPREAPGEAKQEFGLIQQLVNELISGINSHDLSVCNRLFSQHRLKRENRGAATAKCRRDLGRAQSELELSKIEEIRVSPAKDGKRTAYVQFVAQSSGGKVRYRLHLVRTDSGYLIDGVVSRPR